MTEFMDLRQKSDDDFIWKFTTMMLCPEKLNRVNFNLVEKIYSVDGDPLVEVLALR